MSNYEFQEKLIGFGKSKKLKIKQRKKHINPIPTFDDDYNFDGLDEVMEEIGWSLKEGENIFLVGPPGVGKTTLIEQVASLLDWGLIQASCSANMSEKDIFGKWILTKEGMEFLPDFGLLGYRKGMIVVFNEFDALTPEVIFSMHDNLLSTDSQYLAFSRINQNNKPVSVKIKRNHNYRFVATANTTGRGDDLQLYHGTNIQNEATLDRMTVIKMDYHPEPTEIKILVIRARIDEDIAKKMVRVANECRSIQDRIGFIFSLRKLILWGKWYRRIGLERATQKLYSGLSEVDAEQVSNLIKDPQSFNAIIEPE